MKVVLDTNVWVACGFARSSASARLVRAVERGELELVWDEATRAETRHIVQKIPPLSWDRFRDLFREDGRYDGETHPSRYGCVTDPADRKFAALAAAAGAVLVSSDDDLLSVRDRLDVEVCTPSELARRLG